MTPDAPPARMVFVLGTGRCGSTLVQEVLSRHPDVGFLSNLEDRWPFLPLSSGSGRLYRALPPRLTEKGRLRFAPSEGYRALTAKVSPALAAPSRDLTADDATPWLTQRTRTFFETYARATAGDVFLHKFTGWPRVGFLRAVWPEAKFVHIVRDGRAVANSLVQMPWWRGWQGPEGWTFGPLDDATTQEWNATGRSFVALAGLEWRLLMDAFAGASVAVHPEDWLELRYEDIVAAPRRMFSLLLDHCGLDWTAGFERGFTRHSFRSGRTDAYRGDLGLHEVDTLEIILDRQLRRHGYIAS